MILAQYYADIQGNRGQATRMGTKKSGMSGHIRGWDVGCRVDMYQIDGEDVCCVYLSSGSNGVKSSRHLGTFTAADLDKTQTPSVTPDAVAKVIKTQRDLARVFVGTKFAMDRISGIVTNLADLFAKDNPRFDRERFLAACGIS